MQSRQRFDLSPGREAAAMIMSQLSSPDVGILKQARSGRVAELNSEAEDIMNGPHRNGSSGTALVSMPLTRAGGNGAGTASEGLNSTTAGARALGLMSADDPLEPPLIGSPPLQAPGKYGRRAADRGYTRSSPQQRSFRLQQQQRLSIGAGPGLVHGLPLLPGDAPAPFGPEQRPPARARSSGGAGIRSPSSEESRGSGSSTKGGKITEDFSQTSRCATQSTGTKDARQLAIFASAASASSARRIVVSKGSRSSQATVPADVLATACHRPTQAARSEVLDASVDAERDQVLGSAVVAGVCIPAPPRLAGPRHALITLADVALAIPQEAFAGAVSAAVSAMPAAVQQGVASAAARAAPAGAGPVRGLDMWRPHPCVLPGGCDEAMTSKCRAVTGGAVLQRKSNEAFGTCGAMGEQADGAAGSSQAVAPATTGRATSSKSSRKDKSLGLLCENFLAHFGRGALPDFQLDDVASILGVERRRVYDVINILEALRMTSRKEKNKYVWHGTGSLPAVLQHLQNQAFQDPHAVLPGTPREPVQPHAMECRVQTAPGLHIEVFSKEIRGGNSEGCGIGSGSEVLGAKRNRISSNDPESDRGGKRRAIEGGDGDLSAAGELSNVDVDCVIAADAALMPPSTLRESANVCSGACVAASVARASLEWRHDLLAFRDARADDCASNAKRDKSLGFLAQRFVQLFLVGRDVLALEHAAKILMVSQGLDATSVDPSEAAFKTRVRRLYDVANVLQSLRLVTKVTFTEPSCARKPAFAWRGLGAVPLLPGRVASAVKYEVGRALGAKGGPMASNGSRHAVQPCAVRPGVAAAGSDGSGGGRASRRLSGRQPARSAKVSGQNTGPLPSFTSSSLSGGKGGERFGQTGGASVSARPSGSHTRPEHKELKLVLRRPAKGQLNPSECIGGTFVSETNGGGGSRQLSLEQKFQMGHQIANEEAYSSMSPGRNVSPSSRSAGTSGPGGCTSVEATPLHAVGGLLDLERGTPIASGFLRSSAPKASLGLFSAGCDTARNVSEVPSAANSTSMCRDTSALSGNQVLSVPTLAKATGGIAVEEAAVISPQLNLSSRLEQEAKQAGFIRGKSLLQGQGTARSPQPRMIDSKLGAPADGPVVGSEDVFPKPASVLTVFLKRSLSRTGADDGSDTPLVSLRANLVDTQAQYPTEHQDADSEQEEGALCATSDHVTASSSSSAMGPAQPLPVATSSQASVTRDNPQVGAGPTSERIISAARPRAATAASAAYSTVQMHAAARGVTVEQVIDAMRKQRDDATRVAEQGIKLTPSQVAVVNLLQQIEAEHARYLHK